MVTDSNASLEAGIAALNRAIQEHPGDVVASHSMYEGDVRDAIREHLLLGE